LEICAFKMFSISKLTQLLPFIRFVICTLKLLPKLYLLPKFSSINADLILWLRFLCCIFSSPSRINLLQLRRYSFFGELLFRPLSETGFSIFSFNKALFAPCIYIRNAVAFDPSFIHKSSKQTPAIGCFGRDERHLGELKS